MKNTITSLIALAGTLAFAAPAAAQGTSGSDFTWSRAMGSGSSLSIKNMDGPIEVHPATGNRVEVRGDVRSGDASDVRFIVDTTGDDITICTHSGDDDRARCNRNNDGGTWS